MSTGVRFVGKGPDGIAKAISVNDDGVLLTELLGSSLVGEVAENPTANTILGRMKSLESKLDTLGVAIDSILAKIIASPATEAKQAALEALVGTLTDTAVNDPTASGTIIALLKGLITQMQGDGASGKSMPVQLSGSNVVLDTKAMHIKTPTSRLIFDEYIDTRSLYPIAKSYVPGKSYGIDHGWVAVSEDAWKTKTNGISFSGQGNGSCTAMVVWPDESICAITSTGKIVTMADINSNHVVTLETVGLFGGFADFYCDGLNRIVVAGEYTQGDSVAKKLYLSMDGGATFEIIKTGDTLGLVNNHWHGVCYDPYSGAIWAAQGDSENAKIYFTYDLGVTWHEVDAQGQRFQPTLIHAFPDKVIFGEDINTQKPGLFTYKRVGNEQPTTITLDRLLTFRTDKGANVFYPDKRRFAEANANEVYIYFGGSDPMKYIYGTGDGGNTWHLLYAGTIGFSAMQVVGEYLIGSRTIAPLRGVFRAKLPQWV